MDFQTDTKTASKRRHRLYVAVPLFVLFAWFGVPHSGALMSTDLSVVRSDESGLIAGKSLVTTMVEDVTFIGWNGAFHIDASTADRMTVAALTTPVLAVRGDARWLVPVGMQLTIDANASDALDASWLQSHRPLKLPAHYLRDMLPQTDALMEQSQVSALPAVNATIPPLLGSGLRFAAAESRAQERNTALRLSALTKAMKEGDEETVDALLLEQSTHNALQHASVSSLWTVLSLALSSGRDALILPFLLGESDASLIARYHPQLSDRAWVYPASAADRSMLLAHILLPRSDRDQDPRPEPVIRAWHDGWQSLLQDEAQAAFIRETVLPVIREDIEALDRDGYPARARAYSDALAAVFGSDQGVIQDSQIDLTEPPSEEVEEAEVKLDQPIEIIPEDQVRSDLLRFGVMFTSKSSLTLHEDGSYAVRDIVLGTASGDRVLSFDYQPSRDIVSGIEHDGKILPYSLSLEQYLAWVKGEK